MAADTIKRYSIIQVRRVTAELEAWIESSQDALDNAESMDSPNEDRIEALANRIDALQAALDALQEIE